MRRRIVPSLALLLLLLAFAGGAGAHDDAPTPTALAAVQSGHDHHGQSDEGREPTAEERAAADRLVQATREGVARFADIAVAEAAGYRVATPFAFYGARAAHFHNPRYGRDGRLLDPERPEDLIYLKTDDGRLVLLGVMYLAPIGQGPVTGGPLTRWHAHEDLCASPDGVAPSLPTGECPAGTRPIGVEMLHVWVVDHPDGPFAERPPPATVTVPVGPLVAGGSMAVGASLIDSAALTEAIAQALGLSSAEIGWRFAAGESLAEMAADQGVPREVLVRVIEDRFRLDFERAVAVGDMTPSQRDQLVRSLPMMVERMVELHAGEAWLIAPEETAGH